MNAVPLGQVTELDVAPAVDWAPVYVPRAMGDTEPDVQDAVAAVETMKDISAANASQPLTVFLLRRNSPS